MNTAIPPIHESAEDLKRLLNQERQRDKQQRLHALYLLASGQARYRTTVAALIGVSRGPSDAGWRATLRADLLCSWISTFLPGKPLP